MDTLLGFIVLTGPLFLIVLWVPMCLALAFLVGKKCIKKSLTLKIAGGIAVFLIMLLFPVADEIAGRIYLNHLCETEAGVKVYQTIELPAEYWDEEGKPLFMNSRGVLNMKLLGDRFEWKRQINPYINNFSLRINNYQRVLFNKQTLKVIGEKNSFSRDFGWILTNFTPAPNKGEGCRSVLARKYNDEDFEGLEVSKEKDFVLQIFTKSTN